MKERLTGALILVALLVILVPEILPGPAAGRPGSEAAPAEAVDGPPLRSYSMELGASGRASGSDQSALAPQAAPPPVADQIAIPDQAKPERSVREVPAPVIEKAAPAAAKPAPAAPAGSWWVQLGSFSQSANAQRLVQTLSQSGFRAQVSPIQNKGSQLYRVRAGPVADRAAAEALQARLAEAGHKGALVAP